MSDQAVNTDKEIWREHEGDYYSDVVFITAQNGLGIDVGGTVFVKPLRGWQELAVENARLRAALEACQWGIINRCPVCAGWDMGPNGETDHVHTKDCVVGIALSSDGK